MKECSSIIPRSPSPGPGNEATLFPEITLSTLPLWDFLLYSHSARVATEEGDQLLLLYYHYTSFTYIGVHHSSTVPFHSKGTPSDGGRTYISLYGVHRSLCLSKLDQLNRLIDAVRLIISPFFPYFPTCIP